MSEITCEMWHIDIRIYVCYTRCYDRFLVTCKSSIYTHLLGILHRLNRQYKHLREFIKDLNAILPYEHHGKCVLLSLAIMMPHAM